MREIILRTLRLKAAHPHSHIRPFRSSIIYDKDSDD